MNIKYASLLSLLCVIAANAEPSVVEKLETAKKKLNDCLNSTQGSIFGCSQQIEEFGEKRDDFLQPHYAQSSPIARGINAEILNKKLKNAWFWQQTNLKLEHCREELASKGHAHIVTALWANEGKDYLSSNKSLTDFLDNSLDKWYTADPCLESEVEDAKAKVMAVIHQQAQKTVSSHAAKLSDIEKFDQAKREWIRCDNGRMSQTPWSMLNNGFISCEKQKQEYDAAMAKLEEQHNIALQKNDSKLAKLLDEKIKTEKTEENRRTTTQLLEITNRTKI